MKKNIILLILLGLLASPALSNESVDDFYDMAKNFFDSGDFITAQEYAEYVLNINPNHYGANCLIVKMTPPKEYLEDNNLSTKIIIRPTKVSTGNNQSDLETNKGQACYAKGDYRQAIMYFENAVKINPSNCYAYNGMGLAYWKLGNGKKAEHYLRKANSVSPTFTIPLDNLAQMFISNDEYKSAGKVLEEAFKRNNKDYCTYYLSGILSKKLFRFQDSIKSFNNALRINPNFALAYMQLADVYFLTEDFAWSNTSLEKYIELTPNDDYGYYMMFRNYFNMEDYNVAKTYILKAIFINNCIDYRIALSDIENKLNNTQGAIDALKVIPIPSAQLLNQIGVYYLQLNDNENALKYFTQCLARPDVRPIYVYNAAQVYKNIGDSANYKKLMSGIECMPLKSYQDYIDLSGIYLDCANKNKALDILNRGLKISPNNRALYEAKLKVYEVTSDKMGIETTKKEIDRIFNQ